MLLKKFMKYFVCTEFGYDNPLDVVFQLQHFPFEEDADWTDKIESGARCEYDLEYRRYVVDSVLSN